MSLAPIAEALSERILNLINDVLAENDGGIVGSFLIGVDFLDSDGEPSFVISSAPEQRGSASMGLARLLTLSTDRDLLQVLNDD